MKKELEIILEKEEKSLDIYDTKTLNFMSAYLGRLAYECRTGKIKPKDERFNHLGRMITDTCDGLIPDELGGIIIDAEKKYMEFEDNEIKTNKL